MSRVTLDVRAPKGRQPNRPSGRVGVLGRLGLVLIALALASAGVGWLLDVAEPRAQSRTDALPVPARATALVEAAPDTDAADDASAEAEVQPLRAWIIRIHGAVDDVLAASLARRCQEALDAGIDVIVFDFNTPGGLVSASFDIVDTIEALTGKIRTIAWVSVEAYSAGAMIAITCDELYIADNAEIGDCQPIIPSVDEQGNVTINPAGEKIESPLRAHFRKHAKRKGIPVALAESMVSSNYEVIEIAREHPAAGPIRPDGQPDDTGDATDAGSQYITLPLVERYVERKELESRHDRDEYIILRTVVPEAELLTMDAEEARDFGFATRGVATLEELVEEERIQIEAVVGETWSEELVRILSALGFLLLIAGGIAGYIEFKSPGFGIPGALAIICFALFFFSKALMGLAGWEEVILFVAGIILLGVEIFVVPGFGVPGIAGILCLIAAIFLAGQKFVVPVTPYDATVMNANLIFLGVTLVGIMGGMYLVAKLLPKMPYSRALILGGTSSTDTERHRAAVGTERDRWVGLSGVTTTPLRPGGKIRIGEQLVQAQSQGGYLEAGQPVIVIESRANRVIVKPLPQAST